MSSSGQKRGSCGYAMASFDGHLYCAHCRDKGKGKDTCVESKDSSDCVHCNALTPEQRAQLATPSYKLKKEKREAKKLETDTSTQDTGVPSGPVGRFCYWPCGLIWNYQVAISPSGEETLER